MPWTLPRALVLASAIALVMGIVLATGDPVILFTEASALPFTILVALILVAALIPRAWAQLTAGLLTGLLGVLALGFSAAAIARPQAATEFTTLLLIVLAVAMGVPAGIRAFAASRRKRALPPARAILRDPHGRVVAALALVLSGAAATSALSWAYEKRALDAPPAYVVAPEASVPILIAGGSYPEAPVAVPRGDLVEIAVQNRETAFHTFTYLDGGTERTQDLLPGTTTRFLVRFDAPGVVAYRCLPHSSSYAEGMVGTLLVS